MKNKKMLYGGIVGAIMIAGAAGTAIVMGGSKDKKADDTKYINDVEVTKEPTEEELRTVEKFEDVFVEDKLLAEGYNYLGDTLYTYNIDNGTQWLGLDTDVDFRGQYKVSEYGSDGGNRECTVSFTQYCENVDFVILKKYDNGTEYLEKMSFEGDEEKNDDQTDGEESKIYKGIDVFATKNPIEKYDESHYSDIPSHIFTAKDDFYEISFVHGKDLYVFVGSDVDVLEQLFDNVIEGKLEVLSADKEVEGTLCETVKNRIKNEKLKDEFLVDVYMPEKIPLGSDDADYVDGAYEINVGNISVSDDGDGKRVVQGIEYCEEVNGSVLTIKYIIMMDENCENIIDKEFDIYSISSSEFVPVDEINGDDLSKHFREMEIDNGLWTEIYVLIGTDNQKKVYVSTMDKDYETSVRAVIDALAQS